MYKADLIQSEMEKQELSVMDLARESGLSRPTIYNLLDAKHKPELDTLQAVARALKIPLSELIVEAA